MLVVDTDIFSIIARGTSPEAARVRERIRASGERATVTIVTFEEQMRGRLARCHRSATPEQYATAARSLHEALEDFRPAVVLDFDRGAADEFRQLKAAKVRIGTNDLRIAAVVLANDASLITRNLSDFRKVPRLRADDWTR